MKKILFICSLNRIRSLTAEHLFKDYPGIKVRSAGTQDNARIVVGHESLQWADIVFVMERHHKEKIERQFPDESRTKRILVLDIPNGFEYMDPELVEMLQITVKPHLA